jgi:hypothetical protein
LKQFPIIEFSSLEFEATPVRCCHWPFFSGVALP